jgi:Rrf2 family protein
MRLPKTVETGLHLCVLLAAAPAGEALAASDLADFHDLPPAAVAKMLSSLAGRGVLATTEGRSGGYRLARPAAEISVAEVVEALEGRDGLFRCLEIRQRGPCAGPASGYRAPCAIAATMADAESAWWEVLAARSLEDIGRHVGVQLDHKVRQRSEDWLAERSRP